MENLIDFWIILDYKMGHINTLLYADWLSGFPAWAIDIFIQRLGDGLIGYARHHVCV